MVPVLGTTTMQLQDGGQQKKEEGETEMKTEKCHMIARPTSRMSAQIKERLKNMKLVLRSGRVFLENKNTTTSHVLTGYFLPYPEKAYDGLVSTINAENMLNWVFIDKDDYQMRYGVRADSAPNLTGPMALSYNEQEEEHRLTFNNWEGFVAVEEPDGSWGVYFDKEDNALGEQRQGRLVVELELIRSPVETNESADPGVQTTDS